MISGLCRHMSIQAVSRHLGIRWKTVKNIDRAYLKESFPVLDPTQLTGLKYLGVDEVARAKGHDYMTVIYDMVEGHLIGVETGRTADVFSAFLKQLPAETTGNIAAGSLVPDSRSIDPAVPKEVCKVVEKPPCGHLQLREAQAHRRQDRGWQHQYRHDPQARQRHQGYRVFQTKDPTVFPAG